MYRQMAPIRQVTPLLNAIKSTLKDNCVGIYIHGSVSLGAYQRDKSDIDFLVVIKHNIDNSIRYKLAQCVKKHCDLYSGKGIEFSVVLQRDCQALICDVPYQFHYSKDYQSMLIHNLNEFLVKCYGTDRDLPTHFELARQCGIVFYGIPINDVFSPVPKAILYQSFYHDLAGVALEKLSKDKLCEYLANLYRTHYYLEYQSFISKNQAMIYGEKKLSDVDMHYRCIVSNNIQDKNSSYTALNAFAQQVLNLLHIR